MQPPDTLLLLVRHAEQQSLRVFDAELSVRGHAQAERLADRLARLPVTAVVSSTLRRARQTAAVAAGRLGLEAEVEEDLDEVRITDEDRARRYGAGPASGLEPEADDDAYARAALTLVRLAPVVRWADSPGAESLDVLRARGLAAVERVLARHRGGVVVVVTHGGMLNAVLGAWVGARRDLWFVPWHTGVSTVAALGDERVVVGVNDASHLREEEELVAVMTGSLASGQAGRG